MLLHVLPLNQIQLSFNMTAYLFLALLFVLMPLSSIKMQLVSAVFLRCQPEENSSELGPLPSISHLCSHEHSAWMCFPLYWPSCGAFPRQPLSPGCTDTTSGCPRCSLLQHDWIPMAYTRKGSGAGAWNTLKEWSLLWFLSHPGFASPVCSAKLPPACC